LYSRQHLNTVAKAMHSGTEEYILACCYIVSSCSGKLYAFHLNRVRNSGDTFRDAP